MSDGGRRDEFLSAIVAVGLLLFGGYRALASGSSFCGARYTTAGGYQCTINICQGNPKPACTMGVGYATFVWTDGTPYVAHYHFCSCPDAPAVEDDCCHLIIETDGPHIGTVSAVGECDGPAMICGDPPPCDISGSPGTGMYSNCGP